MLIDGVKYKKHYKTKLSEENTLPTNGNFMVSNHFDIIKFLLIYRYLQNTYWFKRGTIAYYQNRGCGKTYQKVTNNSPRYEIYHALS